MGTILMETKIWVNNGWCNIKPEDTVNTHRRLHSFCAANLLPDCIVKTQGGYYYPYCGILKFLSRRLTEISFETVYNLKYEKQKTNNRKRSGTSIPK